MTISDTRFKKAFKKEPRLQGGRLSFFVPQEHKQHEQELRGGINKLKTFLKRSPAFYNFLTKTISVELFVGFTPKKAIKKVFNTSEIKEKIILNIGSGVIRLHPEVINVDIAPFRNVDVVADVRQLPFKDNSIDMIIAESLLEHIDNVQRAISEIQRVVRPGGYIWIKVPFMYPFHASPNDYHRWTHEGLKQAFDGFQPLSVGIFSGPMTTLLATIAHWLALLFSFGSRKIHPFLVAFFMAILSPLKIFDLLFRLYPAAIESAAFLYYYGRKL